MNHFFLVQVLSIMFLAWKRKTTHSKISPHVIFFFFGFFALMGTKAQTNQRRYNCPINHPYRIGRIGAVIDESSLVGKEQKLAMEIAVQNFNQWSACSKVVLRLKNSPGKSPQAASAAIDLIRHKKIHSVIGALTLQEAAIVSGFGKVTKNIPIIILNSAIMSPQVLPQQPSPIIQMSNDITIHMQCLANIIGHFGWGEVTAIYEPSNSFSMNLGLVTHLSDSLIPFNAFVQHHIAFPPIVSLLEPEAFIEEELKKLKEKSNRVFVILQSSLNFTTVLFKKAKENGMMGKGYVWMISDDIASLLDSMEPSVILDMQGVIGFKTSYTGDNGKSYREFRLKFRRKYITKYTEDDQILSPSKYAFQAYDAIWAIAKAMRNSEVKSPEQLVQHILSSDFEGLSGKISFKNGSLWQKPVFSIINVIGKSYRQIAQWSPDSGLSEELTESGGSLDMGLNTTYWPGGEQTVPSGWISAGTENPLKIGVPARSAFDQFVQVKCYQEKNKTSVTGFSIDVFEAAVKQLPYDLPFVLIPYNGSYDEMVMEVHNKVLDAAVGDTTILADRYEWAEFSLPYVESSIVMIVPAKSDVSEERFAVMKAFKLEMWVVMGAMNLWTSMVIYLNENINGNPDFVKSSLAQHIGSALWLSITFLSLSQRQSIKHNLSRLVLATWLCVIIVVTACFTAVLSSMMTVKRLHPSETDIDHLLKTNAAVGCNGQSFITRYLETVLHFKTENVRKINTVDDYPEAFERGYIAAAFLSSPHAKVFLAKYCKGYTMAGPTWKFGGMGFVFQKHSYLATDISTAILKITQDGEIHQLETRMLSSCNCSSSTVQADDPSLGLVPFSGLLLISGTICAIVFISAITRQVGRHWSIYGSIQSLLINTRVCRWATLLLTQWFTRYGFKFFGRPINIGRRNSRMDVLHGHTEQNLMV